MRCLVSVGVTRVVLNLVEMNLVSAIFIRIVVRHWPGRDVSAVRT